MKLASGSCTLGSKCNATCPLPALSCAACRKHTLGWGPETRRNCQSSAVREDPENQSTKHKLQEAESESLDAPEDRAETAERVRERCLKHLNGPGARVLPPHLHLLTALLLIVIVPHL